MRLIGSCLFKKIVNKIGKKKKLPPLKHILALPTWGQEGLHSDTDLIEKVNFDSGHPVIGPLHNLGCLTSHSLN